MKPILFNTSMVQAILERRKTTTRRIIKVDNSLDFVGFGFAPKEIENTATFGHRDLDNISNCKIESCIKDKYLPGDILYVRETFAYRCEVCDKEMCIGCNNKYAYKADDNYSDDYKWKPSIHMPQKAARIFLKVTNVRVERLQDITEDDVKAEGIEPRFNFKDDFSEDIAKQRFCELWDSTVNKKETSKYGWGDNPYVWVIEFKRISKEDALKEDK